MRFVSSLAGVLILSSCASPSINRLDELSTSRPEIDALLNDHKLTPGTSSVLEEAGLAAVYRRDPAEAISQLRGSRPSGWSAAKRLAVAELCSDTGSHLAEQDPQRAVGYFLAAAELSFEDVLDRAAENSASPLAAIYNHSAGEVAHILFDSDLARGQTSRFEGPWKSYLLQSRTEGGSFTFDFFDILESADYVELKNYDMEHVRRLGVGAAMVGHRKGTSERREANPFLSPIGMTVPVNALLDFRPGGDEVKLRLTDLLSKEEIVVGDRKIPLAADLTMPIAVQVDYDIDRKHAFKAMTHPDKYSDHSGLYLLEPFRPDKIPVIFVHGLMSKPEVWVEALNRLRADPVLTRKYQLLVYRYPTGYPIIYNMASLRKQLAAFQEHFDPRRRNPNMRKMILVGHSMGSVLTNSLIRNHGDAFTDYLFTKPIDELDDLDDEEKATLKDLLIFDSNPDITRAVLLAGPFRGSKKSTGAIGSLGRSLIKLPGSLFANTMGETLVDIEGMTEEGRSLLSDRPDSIGSLKPGAPVLTCILENPIRKGVRVHTIIGRHDPAQPLEESSDGTVPYTSAHLDEAVSEKVVHAKHTPLCKHPDTLEEIRRILYLHGNLGSPRER